MSAITPSMISDFRVDQYCEKNMEIRSSDSYDWRLAPCSHACTITLSDGRTKKVKLNLVEIQSLSIAIEHLNPVRKHPPIIASPLHFTRGEENNWVLPMPTEILKQAFTQKTVGIPLEKRNFQFQGENPGVVPQDSGRTEARNECCIIL